MQGRRGARRQAPLRQGCEWKNASDSGKKGRVNARWVPGVHCDTGRMTRFASWRTLTGGKFDVDYRLPGYAVRCCAIHFPGGKQLHGNGPGGRGCRLRTLRHFWPDGPQKHSPHLQFTAARGWLTKLARGAMRTPSEQPNEWLRKYTKTPFGQWVK